MNAFPRIDKRDSFQLTKGNKIEGAHRVILLIDHPAAGREWTLLGQDKIPGFYHLEISTLIGKDFYSERMEYQHFSLLLPENQFQRIQ
jgi:hypothetical protein